MVRSRPTKKWKWLGACAMVLGLMAISGVSSAQAEKGAFWGYINAKGELVKFGAALEPTLGFEIEELFDANDPGRHLVILTRVIGLNVAILCTQLTSDMKLKAEGLVLGLWTFHNCITKINGKTEPGCLPHSIGQKPGLIKTLELDGLIVLHKLEIGGEIDDVVKFGPDVAGAALVDLEFGEECVLPITPIFGTLTFKDCQKEFLVHKVVHLWEEFKPLTKLWAISDTAEHLETSIDGSVNVFLTGAHLGLKWAGTPA